MNNKPKLVSLFSGCGGIDLGFINAGYDIVFANDFNNDACLTYKENIGEIDNRDICSIPSSEIPECDIITAGFPCQPFSSAGKRKGIYDSRGTLYQECLRIIKDKSPSVILFENVKGLKYVKYYDGSSLLEIIIQELYELGYNVSWKILNASDYEVPQRRERIFIIGIKKEIDEFFIFPEAIEKTEKLFVKSVVDIPETIPNQIGLEMTPSDRKLIENIKEGQCWRDVPYEKLPDRLKKMIDNKEKYHNPTFYRRYRMNDINGTITATVSPSYCGFTHPKINRLYNIREAARFQTFPDTYIFKDSSKKEIRASYKMIGNAVPVKLAEHIGKAIKEQFFDKENTSPHI